MNNKIKFPDNFFNQQRPTVSNKETLKDITPIKWNNSKAKEVIVYSSKERKVL